MGSAQNQSQLRAGITPVQRLHREAISEHGDALQLGARSAFPSFVSATSAAGTAAAAAPAPPPRWPVLDRPYPPVQCDDAAVRDYLRRG